MNHAGFCLHPLNFSETVIVLGMWNDCIAWTPSVRVPDSTSDSVSAQATKTKTKTMSQQKINGRFSRFPQQRIENTGHETVFRQQVHGVSIIPLSSPLSHFGDDHMRLPCWMEGKTCCQETAGGPRRGVLKHAIVHGGVSLEHAHIHIGTWRLLIYHNSIRFFVLHAYHTSRETTGSKYDCTKNETSANPCTRWIPMNGYMKWWIPMNGSMKWRFPSRMVLRSEDCSLTPVGETCQRLSHHLHSVQEK